MIRLEGVSKTFAQRGGVGYTALEDIGFEIGKGEFVSILGPSGCGKSTLLNLVAGLERADRGRVEANGKAVAAPGPDRIVVFQDHALYPWLTVLENVAFGLKQKGIGKRSAASGPWSRSAPSIWASSRTAIPTSCRAG